ncbi:MAG: 4-hydroxythreonine-4-phosphate dehydrogenase PdxA [Chromatiaceae bacterium]|jgi:4-hydroxythreonine-4-phosphate dehydrogenase
MAAGGRQLPRIALTPGEPAGIGPELCVQIACHEELPAELVAIADARLLHERADHLGLSLELLPFDADASPTPHRRGTLKVLAVPLCRPAVPGVLDPHNAGYVVRTLGAGCDGCLSGQLDALVTGPVHKGVINEAGTVFTGHTEFLAERCSAVPVMMLMAPGLRVALATTHLPLAKVSAHLTQDHLERVIRVLFRDLRKRFAIDRPRVVVCGLNPHAGEGGHLGKEEVEVIDPVLTRLRTEGFDLVGPVPADTAFLSDKLQRTDAVLAMYHDQGLPVLKRLGFGQAVNVTLGLPIIRTSVDHGTALDLAGTGQADRGSLRAAVITAIGLVERASQ